MTSETKPQKRGTFARFLDGVEWLGNLLPHPVTLFALICQVVLVVSGIAGYLEWAVADPRPEGTKGRSPDGMIRAVSLLTPEGLRRIGMGLVTNFTSLLRWVSAGGIAGCGCRRTGWPLGAAIRAMVLGAPRNLLTAVVVFAAVVSNTASEIGYVVLVPLAAVVFHSVGRNPLVGLAAAFAGVSGGYSANILIGTVDPLLSGITTEAAQIIDASYALGGANEVLPTANYYFMFVSTFLITIVGPWSPITLLNPSWPLRPIPSRGRRRRCRQRYGALSADEKRGLKLAGLTLWGCLRCLPPWPCQKMAGFVTPLKMKPWCRTCDPCSKVWWHSSLCSLSCLPLCTAGSPAPCAPTATSLMACQTP